MTEQEQPAQSLFDSLSTKGKKFARPKAPNPTKGPGTISQDEVLASIFDTLLSSQDSHAHPTQPTTLGEPHKGQLLKPTLATRPESNPRPDQHSQPNRKALAQQRSRTVAAKPHGTKTRTHHTKTCTMRPSARRSTQGPAYLAQPDKGCHLASVPPSRADIPNSRTHLRSPPNPPTGRGAGPHPGSGASRPTPRRRPGHGVAWARFPARPGSSRCARG